MQNTLTHEEQTTEAARPGLVRRARVALAGKVVAIAAIVAVGLSGGIAGATTDDPTGGAASSLSDEVTGWVTTYGIPMLVAVFALGLIIAVLVKLGKRSVRSL
jgi:hypothetical protein